MALHPIEQAPPVLYSQVELLRALGVLCSSSFEGCHGQVDLWFSWEWKVPQSSFLQQVLIYPL